MILDGRRLVQDQLLDLRYPRFRLISERALPVSQVPFVLQEYTLHDSWFLLVHRSSLQRQGYQLYLHTVTLEEEYSFISLVKDTSLAATITVTEMFQKGQQVAAATYEPLWLYIEVAFIYLMFSTVLSYAQSMLERRFDRSVAK